MTEQVKFTSSHKILILALIVAAIACYFLLAPYINSIVMAFVTSILLLPIHNRLESKFPNHSNTIALLSCILLTFIIVLPLLLVFGAIVQQGSLFSQNLYSWVTGNGIQDTLQHPIVSNGLRILNDYLPFDAIEPNQIVEKVAQLATSLGSSLVGASAQILGEATNFLISFFLMLFVLFFFLRDREKLINALRHILPLSRSQEDRILNEIEQVSKSAVLGSFLTAIAQGAAGGLGMWMAGFSGLFWGTMMGFASFIPVVGTALIWVPATIYLIIVDETFWAVFLAIWSVAFVGSIDNFLRPMLMQGSSGMSTLLVFFSLLGGIHLFGLIGLIYGPLIFAITIVLFNIYETEFKDFLDAQDQS
ncbi:AI-2E family transporter [Vibrio diabolicus]|uniref:AI-2E family transporter n=1 Tax=Vibrio diabolicus TaxID=50719 RepID=UPI00215F2633|nr:AI-2E family transporter [Vibrio diabolicus]MCS0309024.1 AI-2E family transporter [Vibrio diabolicus]